MAKTSANIHKNKTTSHKFIYTSGREFVMLILKIQKHLYACEILNKQFSPNTSSTKLSRYLISWVPIIKKCVVPIIKKCVVYTLLLLSYVSYVIFFLVLYKKQKRLYSQNKDLQKGEYHLPVL